MKPEIESLAQQLIEAASFAPGWVKGDPISEELMAAWTNVANPANITAVIRGFREELKQLKADECKAHMFCMDSDQAIQKLAALRKGHAEELKQARREAIELAALRKGHAEELKQARMEAIERCALLVDALEDEDGFIEVEPTLEAICSLMEKP